MEEADKKRYKKLYLKTGRVYIRDMQKNIDALRKNHTNTNAIENLFLCAHALRGQSLLMGYTSLGNYLESVEKVFNARKRHILDIDAAVLNALEAGIERVAAAFRQIEVTGSDLDFLKEIRYLQEAAGTKIYI